MTALHLIWPRFAAALFLAVAVLRPPAQAQSASLASWNQGPAQQAIIDFVRITTDKASQSYVLPEDRIATFDQDGTLWVEQPLFTQAMFALDRVRALAPAHPEWKAEEPFRRCFRAIRGRWHRLPRRIGPTLLEPPMPA